MVLNRVMRFLGLKWFSPVCCFMPLLDGQVPTAPVVQPRGVVNAYTQLPAPAQVGQGGLIHINGINLAPPEGWKASGLPLPIEFGEPALRVLINNRPAALVEATPSRITAQVPFETPPGLANVIVRRGEEQSRPARVMIQNLTPSVQASNGAGFGPAVNVGSGGTLKLTASSLGATNPVVATGEAASEAATPRAPIRVYVGGLAAATKVSYSTSRPGEFEVEVQSPDGSSPGDVIVVAANAADANPVTMGKGPSSSEVIYLPFPEGTSELRSLRSSDLDGLFLNANSPRGADTCFPSFQIDARRNRFEKIEGCLTTAQAQALTPFIDSVSSGMFAAFEGPFEGTPQPGQQLPVSNKVRIFVYGAEPVLATLPEPAAVINGQAGGVFVAVAPGTPGVAPKNFRIDSRTGEVEEIVPGGGAAAPGAVNPQGLLQRFQNLDLGDGITRLLSPPSQSNNQIVLTAGDSITEPTRAKVAVFSVQGELIAQRDFPEGWLPIVAPAPQAQQPPPGGGGGQQPANQQRTPTPVYMDGQTRNYYVAVRNAEGKHGWAHFPPEGDAQLIEVPEGWFFAACVPNIPVFGLELARGIALMGASVDDRSFKNPCPAEGFLLFDLIARRFQAVGLPGSGKLNASGGADEINDFLIGANFDPATRNTSDTFYALDGVNATAFRLDLPPGVNGFSGATRIPALNLIAALANNRIAGDAGIVLFDLERTEARLLPTPEGFANITFLGVLPSIRRLVARGMRAGGAGSQLLVYNLENGDLEIVANPEGVAWIGSPPGQQGQPGQPGQQVVNIPARLNTKSNSVEGIAYGEDRRQMGVVVVRIH
jgi:uncharacterized protein (TIGR03437 family)